MMRNLSDHIAVELSLTASQVTSHLYKLLLYKSGGFFKKHRDTEKANGMFGTLVVQLPSVYSGGFFVVSHAQENKTFDLGSNGPSAYACHFVAHYADCEHEIKPVEAGYRLALVYCRKFQAPRQLAIASAHLDDY